VSYTDIVYNQLIHEILENGVWDDPRYVRARYADGTIARAKSITGVQLKFDNSEVVIPTSKRVPEKAPIHELLWIWQDKSNNVQDLRNRGVRIWDEWEIKEGEMAGTIGPAYGHQLGVKCRNVNGIMMDQVDYVIYMLKNNPGSRRIMTTLWDKDDLDKMALTPCVWATHWLVKDGKLDLIIQIRSNDMALGNPFNIYQYNVLQRMMAQVTGYELGTFTVNIDDAHIYDRHIEGLRQQIQEKTYPAPKIWINPEIKDFYEFTVDDIKLIDYQWANEYKYEIAI